MKRDFMHVFEAGEQQSEIPRVQRRMGMAAHIHRLPEKNIAGVQGMQRINLCVLAP